MLSPLIDVELLVKLDKSVQMGKYRLWLQAWIMACWKNLEITTVFQIWFVSNAIFCGGCMWWIHKECNDIKDHMRLPLTLNSDAIDVWKRTFCLKEEQWEHKVKWWNAKGCPRVLLSKGYALDERGCKLAVATHLQMFMRKILPNGYQIPSTTMCCICGSDRRLRYSTCVKRVMPFWPNDRYVMATCR